MQIFGLTGILLNLSFNKRKKLANLYSQFYKIIKLYKAKGRDKLFLLKYNYQVYKYTCNNLKYFNYTIIVY